MNNHLLLRNRTHPILRNAAAIVAVLALAVLPPWAAAHSKRVIPAVGAYKASGRNKPANFTVRAQVKRKNGRKVISSQVTDTCGGFATFAPTAISRSPNGVPMFSAKVGAAGISGRWTTSTTIKGRVHTPCADAQQYVMHLTR